MKQDIDIAREASIENISEIAKKINIPSDGLAPIGNYKAKVEQDFIASLNDRPTGKLILVTAASPTPAGEGKTTTTVGLNDGINALGKKSICCLREPSLGPCFGMKGGAAGGGYAQVIPMEDINLHFTGDFHAIGVAHNLLSALLDNSLHWGNSLSINPKTIEWKRVMDMNDRTLRKIITGIGKGNGNPRETGFDITVASEVMAIFCLSQTLEELRERLSNITIGYNYNKERIYARKLSADGSMSALLREAFKPNLVQSLENNPAFIHGGPFANIAHGCNSVIATKTALKLADYVVTEAGFGADLGAEKFFNIKCRQAGISPHAVVLVATIRALKMHGGVTKDNLQKENIDALKKGMGNLFRHIENIKKFNLPLVVGINNFSSDTSAEIEVIQKECQSYGVDAIPCTHWASGSKGIIELSKKVVELTEQPLSDTFTLLYKSQDTLYQKVETICREIYRASNIVIPRNVKGKINKYQEEGFGNYSICMAKTQYSFTSDPSKYGAPDNHEIAIKDVILNTGAKFLVVLVGDIMRMPGLPIKPSANNIEINSEGLIQGLF